MKNKTAYAILSMVIGLVLGASPLLGQGKKELLKKSRVDYLAMNKGPGFTSHGKSYAVIPSLRAYVGVRNSEPGDTAIQRLGETGESVLEKKGNFLIVNSASAAQGAALEKNNKGQMAYPVVVNLDSGVAGFITGEIRVSLKDFNEIEALAESHNLKIIARITPLSLVFYKPAGKADLGAMLDALRNDGRVKQADIEVVENPVMPH